MQKYQNMYHDHIAPPQMAAPLFDAPTPTPTPNSTPSTPQGQSHLLLPTLSHESSLIHLIFHRNRNQHHSSKWWKHFSILKRTLHKLILQLHSLPSNPQPSSTSIPATPIVPAIHLTKTQKKKLKKQASIASSTLTQGSNATTSLKNVIDAYFCHLRRVVIPRCYIAFTSLVATTQFSALGMILLGILARIHRIIGPGTREEQEEDRRKEGAVVTYSPKQTRLSLQDTENDGEMVDGDDDGDDDGGVVISREGRDNGVMLALDDRMDDYLENSDTAIGKALGDMDHDDDQRNTRTLGISRMETSDDEKEISVTNQICTTTTANTIIKSSTVTTTPATAAEIDFFAGAPPLPTPTPSDAKNKKKEDILTNITTTTTATAATSTTATISSVQEDIPLHRPERKKKKKSKKTNEIDDLFASLL